MTSPVWNTSAAQREALPEQAAPRKLAAAVLLCAVDDLRGRCARNRLDAFRWISSGSEKPFSFAFWCKVLNQDAEKMRLTLEREYFSAKRGRLARQVAAGFSNCQMHHFQTDHAIRLIQ